MKKTKAMQMCICMYVFVFIHVYINMGVWRKVPKYSFKVINVVWRQERDSRFAREGARE